MSNITTKNIIKASLLVLITSAVSWLLWGVIASSINTFRESVALNGGTATATQQKLDNMRKEIRTADKYIQKIKSLTVNEGMIPSILNDIESDGVVVSDVSESDSGAIIKVYLESKCILQDCVDIIKDVVDKSYMIGVENINLLEVADDDQEWSLNMRIAIPVLPEHL
jgi:hypothetical protein